MTIEQRGVITLLKSAITGEKLPLPEGFTLENAMPIVEKHSIVPMVYLGAVQCGVPETDPLMQNLFVQYYRRMMRSDAQMQAIRRLFAAFDAQQIDYMPLKGCNMKALYPKPELRQMSDADVLIREEQYDRIVPILQEQGFAEKSDVHNVVTWSKKELVLELHRALNREDSISLKEGMGDGWNLSHRTEGSRHFMRCEDEYLLLFTHFVKHFREQGIGCRHVMDLWIYQMKYPRMDQAYIRAKMTEMHLADFYDNMRAMLDMWFADGAEIPGAVLISDFVFECGLWGKWENHQLWKAAKRADEAGSAKAASNRQIRNYAFPPMAVMQEQFPVLTKAPWLLPAMWVVRALRIVLFQRKKIENAKRRVDVARAENVENLQQMWEYVGLKDFED